MAQESEMKFRYPAALEPQLRRYLQDVGDQEENQVLINEYFDTPEWHLSRAGIGCRLRRWGGGDSANNAITEQTVKLAGSVKNGLHQRPEYNISRNDAERPDLTLFTAEIWPSELTISAINDALVNQFTVTFERMVWLINWPDKSSGNIIEVALDKGEIATDNRTEPVCELELELKQGDINCLHSFSAELGRYFSIEPYNKSKAQRGFELLQKQA